jgi:ketosteroid isomerase-like protein
MSSNIVVVESTSQGATGTELVSAAILRGGVRNDPGSRGETAAPSEAEELVLKVFRLVDEHRLDEMVELMTPDIDFLNPFGRMTGRAAVAANFAPMEVGFPNSRHIIPSIHVAGNTVALEGEWTGTNSGPIATPGGEIATGKTVRFPFAAICRVQDGLLSQVHIYLDLVVMYRLLGLM